MTVTAKITGVEVVTRDFRRLGAAAQRKVVAAVNQAGLELLRKVKLKLSGDVLNIRTGRLRRSINVKFAHAKDMSSASVGTNVVYARIHEFGGKTKPHLILPRNGKALLFGDVENVASRSGRYLKSKGARGAIAAGIESGAMRFAKGVNHPGSVIPARPYLRPSLAELKEEIIKRLDAAARGK